MTDFTTYKTTTGDITSCGSTNVSLSDIALQTDESVIGGIYEAEKYLSLIHISEPTRPY